MNAGISENKVYTDVSLKSAEEIFLEFFFQLLTSENIEYVVLRNYESLPHTVVGSDIDILIDRRQFKKFHQVLNNELDVVGYKIWKKYRKNYNIIQISFAPEQFNRPQDVVRIDFILDNVYWFGYSLLRKEYIFQNRIYVNGIYGLKEPVKCGLTYLNTLLFKGKLKDKYRNEFDQLDHEEIKVIESYFESSFGVFGKKYLHKLNSDKMTQADFYKARIQFLLHKGIFSRSLFRGCSNWVTNLLFRIMYPPGVFIVLIGPDGCGKSTVGQIIQEKCQRLFPGIDRFHLFPKVKLFSRIDRNSQKRWESRHQSESEWELRKKENSFYRSIIRMFYLWGRFWAGYWLWIYPRLMKAHLVVGERWKYDLILDPASKGISLPYIFRKIVYKLSPDAEKTIVLNGDPELIMARKPELPFNEINRQLELIRAELQGQKGIVFVDSTQELRDTTEQVLNVICH